MNIIHEARGHTYVGPYNETWIDLISGIQNVPLGHGHPCVTEALNRVIASGVINTYNIATQSRELLLDDLYHYYPQWWWQICSTGTESIERILQIVKIHRGDEWAGRILYLPGAFHGKSWAVAGARYKDWGSDLFQPLSNWVGEPFDALIYEPVQGLTGDIPNERELRKLCHANGAYLIADEMITGFGRCGPDFMNETADFVACGKGISSGVPITFIGSRSELGDIPTGWTTTASGNAISCEVARATLNVLHNENLSSHASGFEYVAREVFGDSVKGQGALLYITVKDAKEAQRRMKLLRLVALYTDTSIRLAPCLNFPLAEFRAILDNMKKFLGDLL